MSFSKIPIIDAFQKFYLLTELWIFISWVLVERNLPLIESNSRATLLMSVLSPGDFAKHASPIWKTNIKQNMQVQFERPISSIQSVRMSSHSNMYLYSYFLLLCWKLIGPQSPSLILTMPTWQSCEGSSHLWIVHQWVFFQWTFPTRKS